MPKSVRLYTVHNLTFQTSFYRIQTHIWFVFDKGLSASIVYGCHSGENEMLAVARFNWGTARSGLMVHVPQI